jgi:hypothetical protein
MHGWVHGNAEMKIWERFGVRRQWRWVSWGAYLDRLWLYPIWKTIQVVNDDPKESRIYLLESFSSTSESQQGRGLWATWTQKIISDLPWLEFASSNESAGVCHFLCSLRGNGFIDSYQCLSLGTVERDVGGWRGRKHCYLYWNSWIFPSLAHRLGQNAFLTLLVMCTSSLWGKGWVSAPLNTKSWDLSPVSDSNIHHGSMIQHHMGQPCPSPPTVLLSFRLERKEEELYKHCPS